MACEVLDSSIISFSSTAPGILDSLAISMASEVLDSSTLSFSSTASGTLDSLTISLTFMACEVLDSSTISFSSTASGILNPLTISLSSIIFGVLSSSTPCAVTGVFCCLKLGFSCVSKFLACSGEGMLDLASLLSEPFSESELRA